MLSSVEKLLVRTRLIALALVCALFAASAPRATAETLFFQFNSVGTAAIVKLDGYGIYSALHGYYYAGQYSGSVAPTSAGLSGATPFNTFCVDLLHDVNVGQQYQVTVQPTSILAHGAEIAYLYNTFGTSTLNAPNYTLPDIAGTLSPTVYAASLQLAIWDLLANDGKGQVAAVGPNRLEYSLLSSYGVSKAVLNSYVLKFIDIAKNQVASAQYLQSNNPQPSGYVQGQGFIMPGQKTPEPSTVVILGAMVSGYMAVFCYRRRRVDASRGDGDAAIAS